MYLQDMIKKLFYVTENFLTEVVYNICFWLHQWNLANVQKCRSLFGMFPEWTRQKLIYHYHLVKRNLLLYSKLLWNSSCAMLFPILATLLWILETKENRRLFIVSTFRKKSQGAKSGEWGGRSNCAIRFLSKE